MNTSLKEQTIEKARAIMQQKPLFMDTETTGLGNDDEIIEIAIINHEGKLMCNTLVQSQKPIPPAAQAVHGISNADIAAFPRLDQLWNEGLRELFLNYPMCIYNISFDIRMMEQSLAKYGMEFVKHPDTHCVMQLFSEFNGERSGNGYKWIKLSEAAKIAGLEVPENLHRALADTEVTRELMLHMANTGFQLEFNV